MKWRKGLRVDGGVTWWDASAIGEGRMRLEAWLMHGICKGSGYGVLEAVAVIV